MWMEGFLPATHRLILIPILGLIYLLTTCSSVANIHLSKYSWRVWCPYNDFTAPNQVRASQISNSKHQTCLIPLIVALPSTDAPQQPQRNSRPGSIRNRMLQTCTVKFMAGKSKAYEPCLYRPLNQDFTHIVLFVFQCETRLMTWVLVWSRVCGNKRQACGFVFWMNAPVSAFRWLYR